MYYLGGGGGCLRRLSAQQRKRLDSDRSTAENNAGSLGVPRPAVAVTAICASQIRNSIDKQIVEVTIASISK